MQLERRLLALAINKKLDDSKSTKEDQNQSSGGKLSSKLEQRFKTLEGLAITEKQKSDIAKWKSKAEQGDKKALDKIENDFEKWKEIGEKYKKAHEVIMKHGGGHKEEALGVIEKALEDKSGINKALSEKKKLLGDFVNTFEANQKAIEKQVKGERAKASKIWSEKIGKFSVFSKKEQEVESNYWKKELTGKYLTGKEPNFTVQVLLQKTPERLKHLESEAKKRKEVTKERSDVSDIFKNLSETKDPKGHVSLGISKQLARNFSDLDLNQKQSLIEDIKKAANKQVRNKGATAAEAVKNFFDQQREYPKNPKERYNALEEQGLGISDWSDAKKHFEKSIKEVENDEDLSAKEQKKLLKKFEEHRDTCDIALKVNSIRDAVDKDSNGATGLDWPDSLKAHQQYQKQLVSLESNAKSLPKNEILDSKISDLDERIVKNIAICEEEITKLDAKDENKPKNASQAADYILETKGGNDNDLKSWFLDAAVLANQEKDHNEVGENEEISEKELIDRRKQQFAEEIKDNELLYDEIPVLTEDGKKEAFDDYQKSKQETQDNNPIQKNTEEEHKDKIDKESFEKFSAREAKENDLDNIVDEEAIDEESIKEIDMSKIDHADVYIEEEGDGEHVIKTSDESQKQHKEIGWEIGQNTTAKSQEERQEIISANTKGDNLKAQNDGKFVGKEKGKQVLREQADQLFENDTMKQGANLMLRRMQDMSKSEIMDNIKGVGKNNAAADNYEEDRKVA